MSTDYADKTTYETPQDSGHVNLQRSLCRPVERTEGQDRDNHAGTIENNRYPIINDTSVGSWGKYTDYRKFPCSCQSTKNYTWKTAPERVNSGKFSDIFWKFFVLKTLENIESNRFLEKILKNFSKISDSIVDKHRKLCYNRRISVGVVPHPKQKTGLVFAEINCKSLVTNLTSLDQLLVRIITGRLYLASDSSQQTKGTTP